MDQERINKITDYVIKKINNNKSGMDLSSAFDCAGFGPGSPEDSTDPVWGPYNITGIAEFKKWIAANDECLDLESGTPYQAACAAYQHIKAENKEFGDYWNCH
jgi:hypothetical protein